ncbi:hypothetical protein D3C84_1146180 [compost metagenome]
MATPSRYTRTDSPVASDADSVPPTSGVVSLVKPPLATVPTAGDTSSLTAVTLTICAGAVVSMVMV